MFYLADISGLFESIGIPGMQSYLMYVILPFFSKITSDIYLMLNVAVRPEVFWVILPMITSVIFVELYFGMYKNERLGGDSETTNGLLLLWVGINEIKYLGIHSLGDISSTPSLVAVYVLALGFVITAVSFFHILSEKVLFTVSSSLFTSYLAFLSLVFVFSDVFLSISLLSPIILFFMIYLAFRLIQGIEPERY